MSNEPLKTLKAIGLLLSYPESEWVAELPAVLEMVRREAALSPEALAEMEALARRIGGQDLIEAQEAYVALFDRSRPLSLYLFEHVHGESRDRGQAMVDLQETYRARGMEPTANELPDYLPLFLEFLSVLPRSEALGILGDASHIVKALAQRLADRDSDHAAALHGLEALLGMPLSRKAANADVAATDAAIDELWEEPQVGFLGSPNPAECSTACSAGCGVGR